jgi:hypothetical protein
VRVLALLLALFLLATFAPPGLQRDPPLPKVSLLRFEPIPLNEEESGQARVGALRFLGGWAVTSNDFRFGGVSALHVNEGQALAVSDAGWRFRFALPARAGQTPVAVGLLAAGPGDKGGDKKNRDAEALAVEGTRAWIGFEQANEIWRYRLDDWRAEASAAPRAMAKWEENGGSEAMIRLADGRFLVFAEGSGGESEAMLFDRDPAEAGARSVPFRYQPPTGYRITDAAVLPDGRLLLLNRRFQLLKGFSAKLTVAGAPPIRAGALLGGTEIAAFDGPLAQGNLEALSIARENGRTILWLASDDNYNPLQRTVLLKFALEERP